MMKHPTNNEIWFAEQRDLAIEERHEERARATALAAQAAELDCPFCGGDLERDGAAFVDAPLFELPAGGVVPGKENAMNWTETRLRLIEIGIAAERLPDGWQIRINLREADLRWANLSGADLSGADLSGANLSGAGLSGANLREADLSGADLRWANLSGANLREADLSRADLRWANLSGAKLSGADLSGADLSGANLSGAKLSGADLSGADLSGADLHRAEGAFTIGFFGRHHAVAAGGYISIGCERHTYAEWLERYEEIGRRQDDYSDEDIADYGAWIKLAVRRQARIEAVEAVESVPKLKA